MIDCTSRLRQAYILALNGLTFAGVSIPVNEEFLTKPPAIITAGNSSLLQAYVIIQNQTSQGNNINKCGANQNAQLQLDVVTVFNANSGGSLIAEQIANSIIQTIFPIKDMVLPLLPPFNLWRGYLDSTRNIAQETKTSRIFRKILILQHQINQ